MPRFGRKQNCPSLSETTGINIWGSDTFKAESVLSLLFKVSKLLGFELFNRNVEKVKRFLPFYSIFYHFFLAHSVARGSSVSLEARMFSKVYFFASIAVS